MSNRPSASASIRRTRSGQIAAYVGMAAATAYGTLKAIWGAGATVGVHGTPVWHDEQSSVKWILASWGTVALAALAAGILLALVRGWGRGRARRALRVLAWTGCVVMTSVGLIGTGEVVAHAAGLFEMSVNEPGDLAPWVYGYVYGSFLVLGLSFGATAWATRPPEMATGRPALAGASR